jgi:CheY-like chemotaxis protein
MRLSRLDAAGDRAPRCVPADPLLQVPILFLTARSEEVDKLPGLELGGDDPDPGGAPSDPDRKRSRGGEFGR